MALERSSSRRDVSTQKLLGLFQASDYLLLRRIWNRITIPHVHPFYMFGPIGLVRAVGTAVMRKTQRQAKAQDRYDHSQFYQTHPSGNRPAEHGCCRHSDYETAE